jgi:hypothetical protein
MPRKFHLDIEHDGIAFVCPFSLFDFNQTHPRVVARRKILSELTRIRIPMPVRNTFGPIRMLFLARFTRRGWLEGKSVGSISGY